MSKARQRLEGLLEAPERFGFLDLAAPEGVDAVADRVEARLRAENEAIDAAAGEALPRLPGWLRGIARGALGRRS